MSKFDFITGFFSWGEPEKVKPEPTPEPELRKPDLPEVETRKRSERKPHLSKKLEKLSIFKRPLKKEKGDN